MAATLAAAPKPSGLTAAAQLEGGRFRLAALGEELTQADLAGAYFYPFEGGLIDHAAPQAVERGPGGLTLTMAAAPNTPELAAPVRGVIALGGGPAFEVEGVPGPLPTAAAGLGPPQPRAAGLTAPLAIAFAFLGGLILNLMPCVFPVLSMKAAALAGHAGQPSAARAQGLAFLAGVLTTFLGLAGLLIAARAAGESAGWGFQLQSPPVTATLALVMLAVGLNLSGVYHMGLSFQGAGAVGGRLGGLAGSFLTGALAVVVAAPCTAPFMAGAIGFALTQPTPVALSVFAALGLGFAAPFVLISASPALLRRLPGPGPWMARLKRVLALPMYVAAAWLAWVFAGQAGEGALAVLAGGAVLVAAAAWLWGRGQARAHRVWPLRTAAAAAGLFALVSVGAAASLEPGPRRLAADALGGEAYSPARLAALRAENKPVFINFTADWCVSCKVNEAVALSSPRVRYTLEQTGAVYLKGDWTARDPVIAAALASTAARACPCTSVYPAGGGPPTVLPSCSPRGR
jgi:thiol:disulfide interchange protein DsbD